MIDDVMEADDGVELDETSADLIDPTERLAGIIESVLFAAATPIALRKLVEILGAHGARPTIKEVQAAIAALKQRYAPGLRGIQLHDVAGGFQFRTARQNAEWVRAVFRDKPARLGRATLETLAIVAYKQPVTRAEIEAIRGVDVDGVLTTLLTRRLIKIAGRKEAVGRPLIYTTTPEFLETFGLKELSDLPSLKELGPVVDEHADEHLATAESSTVSDAVTAPTALADDTAASPDLAAVTAPGAPAEDHEPGGDRVAAPSGGTDPDGPRPGERQGDDSAGDEGGSPPRSDHD